MYIYIYKYKCMHIYVMHVYLINYTFIVNAVKIRLRLKNTFPVHHICSSVVSLFWVCVSLYLSRVLHLQSSLIRNRCSKVETTRWTCGQGNSNCENAHLGNWRCLDSEGSILGINAVCLPSIMQHALQGAVFRQNGD